MFKRWDQGLFFYLKSFCTYWIFYPENKLFSNLKKDKDADIQNAIFPHAPLQ